MNYSLFNRKKRIKHVITCSNNDVRGVIYPSIGDIFRKFQQGDDISRYVRDTPFTGSVVRFEEFDEIINRNRFFLSALKNAAQAMEKEKKKNPSDEDEKHSDEDEKQ